MRKRENAGRPKRPIKIVFDASPLLVNKTGVAYYTERLVSQLAAAYPNDVQLLGFYYNFLGRRSSAHFPTAPNLTYRRVAFIPSKIIYQLRRWNIEIPLELLTHRRADFVLFTNFLGYPSLFKTPSAPVVHDLSFVDLPAYVSAKNQRDLERFVPKQIKRSKFVLTVSEFSRQRIHEEYGVPSEKIVATPIPPIPPQKHPKAKSQATLQKLGVAQPYLLFLGTVEPRKNIINLLAAYRQLPEKLRRTFSLVIVGRIGWNCDAEVAALDEAKRDGLNIIHLGYVDDVAKSVLYQNAALFTTASHYEGFGMPVLEAMSYGVPCAVSDIPVFREVALGAAAYFDAQEPPSITRAWQKLLEDEARRQKLGQQGKRQAESYRWEDVAHTVFEAIAQNVRR